MNISTATLQGNRAYQEDRLSVSELPKEGTFLAVFDGHGSKWVAQELNTYFKFILRAQIRIAPRPLDYFQILKHAVARAQEKTKFFRDSGSTGSFVWIPADEHCAIVGIVGDSPVIIKNSSGEIWISPDHNVRSNPVEAAAAEKLGGRIYNGYLFGPFGMSENGLQMTRVFGDRTLHSVLNREPELFKIPINDDSWILCGTDGLADPSHTSTTSLQPIIDAIEHDVNTDAEELCNLALSSGSSDNITAILWRAR